MLLVKLKPKNNKYLSDFVVNADSVSSIYYTLKKDNVKDFYANLYEENYDGRYKYFYVVEIEMNNKQIWGWGFFESENEAINSLNELVDVFESAKIYEGSESWC